MAGDLQAIKLTHRVRCEDFTAHYRRLPELLQELPIAKGDGTHAKLLTRLAKIDVLVLDDWGLC